MARKKMDEKQFVNFLQNLSEELEAEAKKTVKWYTSRMAAGSKKIAPVDTGYLMGSIEMTFKEDGLEGYVYVGAEYGYYVEFGTVTHYAQPFFYPVFEQLAPQFIKKMESLLKIRLEG